jgi:ATP-binding cassette subfamily B protein
LHRDRARRKVRGSPTVFRALRPFARPFSLWLAHRRAAAVGFVCILASGLLSLQLPGLAKRGLDALKQHEIDRAATLAEVCLLFAGIALLEATSRFIARKTLIDASRLTEERLKADLMLHIGRLPIAWFNRVRTGDVISRLTQDVELVRFMLGPLPLYGLQALVVVPGAVWLMLQVSPAVTAAAGGALLVLVLGHLLVLPRIQRHSRQVQESIAAISQRAAEDFSGVRVLMNFARARAQVKTFAGLCDQYLGHNLGLVRLRAILNLCIHASADAVVLAVLCIGGLEAAAGHITEGEMFKFLMLLGMIVWPLIATGWMLATIGQALSAARRIEELFELLPETRAGLSETLRGDVEVRSLTFTHAGKERPALLGISFTLRAGQKLGLVGPVGSGKSTLLALLLRLYEPPPHAVFVDGHDVLDLDPQALRKTFAVAPQDPFLFSDTIRGNVCFARDGDGEAAVQEAVHVSALDQDLPSLPEGLDTVIGERGITLSGGQKQRVSLARALAAGSRALVLDDTLSAVDHSTEAVILSRLRERRRGQTMIVSAHRLSAIADADQILFLREGRVVERGTHEELLAIGGEYAAAWRRQQEADALEADAGEGDGRRGFRDAGEPDRDEQDLGELAGGDLDPGATR